MMIHAGDLILMQLNQLLEYFKAENFGSLADREAARPFEELANSVAESNPFSFETVEAVRKLLEAMDCAQRARDHGRV